MSDNVTPLQPYLLRALYQWMEDNSLTPQILVDVSVPGVLAPVELAKDNIIQFNIASRAVRDLLLDDDGVSFNARFSGVPQEVHAPIVAVLGIFAKENGQGMIFNDSVQDTLIASGEKSSSDVADRSVERTNKPSGKPTLKIIK